MQKCKLGSYAHNFERIELESPGCSGFEEPEQPGLSGSFRLEGMCMY